MPSRDGGRAQISIGLAGKYGVALCGFSAGGCYSLMESVCLLLSDQINLLKINEIVDKRGVVLGFRTTFLMAKKWF